MKHNRKGFTLVEILIVLAIIGILAAILLPVLNTARENAKQGQCAANLHQIGLALKLYYGDNKAYPGSFAFLLPRTVDLRDTISATPGATPNKDGGDYLKTSEKYMMCPDDDTISDQPRSSYGDVSTGLFNGAAFAGPAPQEDLARYVWNFYGYKADGTTINPLTASEEADYLANFQALPRYLYDPSKVYDATTNPINRNTLPRLQNRFAPPFTIVTHCVYHRIPTANNIGNPNDLYIDGNSTIDERKNAKDLILRLDGHVDTVDVSTFNVSKTWITQEK